MSSRVGDHWIKGKILNDEIEYPCVHHLARSASGQIDCFEASGTYEFLRVTSDGDVTGRQLQRQCHPERLLHCQEPSLTEWVLQTEQQQVNPFAKELPERGATPSVRQVLRGKV
jgi:hypothetical protein